MQRNVLNRLRRFFGSGHDASALQPHAVWSGTSSFGECPLWVTRFNTLCWLDIPSGTLRAYRATTGVVESWMLGETSAGLTLADDDSLIIGRLNELRHFSLDSGALTPFATLPDAETDERTNDLASDAAGALWVTTMHIGGTRPIGRLLRRSRDGQWTTVLAGLPILNGPAFDASRNVGYVCDTVNRRILRFALPSGASADVGSPEAFVTFAQTDGYPDGITVDADGNLWVAHYEGSRVTCFSPDGQVVRTVAMPVRNPTSVAIGDGTLYVTSAQHPSDRGASRGGTLFAVSLRQTP